MDEAFQYLIRKTIMDYQHGLTVYSELRELHFKNLWEVFEIWKIYQISLNPKKYLFIVTKGKLLGHVVGRKGIYIDPEWVKAINDLKPLKDQKPVQSFFGNINFVWRFIHDYVSIVKPINKLLKKGQKFEWTPEAQSSFSNIKIAITSSPMLVIFDFSKHLIIYSIASKYTIMSVLIQKSQDGNELPISFMSKELHDYELKY